MAVERVWFPHDPDSAITSPDRARLAIGYGGIAISDVIVPVGSSGGETASGMRSIGAEIRNKIGEAINPATEEGLDSILSQLQSIILAAGDNIIGQVKITDGNNIASILGDGDATEDQTGFTLFGFDSDNKARMIKVTKDGFLATKEKGVTDLLLEVAQELKLVNYHLMLITDSNTNKWEI